MKKNEAHLLLTDEFLRVLDENTPFSRSVEEWVRMTNNESGLLELLVILVKNKGLIRIYRDEVGEVVASHYQYDTRDNESAESIAQRFEPNILAHNLLGYSTAFTLSHAILSLPTYFTILSFATSATDSSQFGQEGEHKPTSQTAFAHMYIQDAKRHLATYEKAIEGQTAEHFDESGLESLAESARYLQNAVQWAATMIALSKGADEDTIDSVAQATGQNPLDLELQVRDLQLSALGQMAI